MCSIHFLLVSSWETEILSLWVIRWVPIAWMAFVFAWTQPTLYPWQQKDYFIKQFSPCSALHGSRWPRRRRWRPGPSPRWCSSCPQQTWASYQLQLGIRKSSWSSLIIYLVMSTHLAIWRTSQRLSAEADSFESVELTPSWFQSLLFDFLWKKFSNYLFWIKFVSQQSILWSWVGALDREKWSKIYPEFNGLTSC